MILPLSSALLRPHLDSWLQFWDTQSRKGMEMPERAQQRAGTKMRGLEKLFCEENLGGLLKPGEEKIREGFVDVYKFTKGGYKMEGTRQWPVTGLRGSGTN